MYRIKTLFSSIILAFFIASCGGGGGGAPPAADPGGTPPAATPGSSTVTSANSKQVAAAAVEAASLALAAGESGGGGVLAQPGSVQSKGGLSSTQATAINESIPCDSGTATITGTLALDIDPENPNIENIFSPGDTLTTSWSNCTFEGFTFNGVVDLTIVDFDGDASLFNFSLTSDMAFTNFSVTAPGEGKITMAGGLQVALDLRNPPNAMTNVSGTQMTVTEDDGRSTTLQNFEVDELFNESSGDYSLTTSGTVTSSVFGGPFTYQTLETITGNAFLGEGDPVTGVLLIVADDGTQMTVTAINDNAVDVQLDIDADGDGVFEEMQVSTWAELDAILEESL